MLSVLIPNGNSPSEDQPQYIAFQNGTAWTFLQKLMQDVYSGRGQPLTQVRYNGDRQAQLGALKCNTPEQCGSIGASVCINSATKINARIPKSSGFFRSDFKVIFLPLHCIYWFAAHFPQWALQQISGWWCGVLNTVDIVSRRFTLWQKMRISRQWK